MQISRKADYAIRAVAILSALPSDRSVQAQELAEAGKIPIKFLEQILLVLRRAGILKSKRGIGGGYRLERDSRLISLADVIEAVDGELVRFVDSEAVDFEGSVGISHFLTSTEELVNTRLKSISFEDLIRFDEGDSMVGYGI